MYFRRKFLTARSFILKSVTDANVSHISVAKTTIFLDAEEDLVAEDSSETNYLPGPSVKQMKMGICVFPLQYCVICERCCATVDFQTHAKQKPTIRSEHIHYFSSHTDVNGKCLQISLFRLL
jgi:hypothetical protein